MTIDYTLLDMNAIIGILGLAVSEVDRGETSEDDEDDIRRAIISLRAAGAPVPDHWMPSAQPARAEQQDKPSPFAAFSDDDLLTELRSRGLVLSVWSVDDAMSHIEDDDDCQHLSREQMKKVASELLDRTHRNLEDKLAERGNEHLGDAWCWHGEEILADLDMEAADEDDDEGDEDAVAATSRDLRFRVLAREAFDGLVKYHPNVLTEENRPRVYREIASVYQDTGNNQIDYERLRDAVEKVADQVDAGADDDTE